MSGRVFMELRAVGKRLLARLVLRAYERIVDGIVAKYYHAWRRKYELFFGKRVFVRANMSLVVNFNPTYPDLVDAYNHVAKIVGAKRVSRSTFKVLLNLERDGLVMSVDASSIYSFRTQQYVDNYLFKCKRFELQKRDELVDRVYGVFRSSGLVHCYAWFTLNTEVFDVLYAPMLKVVESLLTPDYADVIRGRVEERIDKYEYVVDELVRLEESLGCEQND